MANEPGLLSLIARAERILRARGAGERLQDVGPDEWQQLILQIAAQARQDGDTLPDDWQASLTRYRDGERLRSDVDDVKLAEQGEVFSREDDA